MKFVTFFQPLAFFAITQSIHVPQIRDFLDITPRLGQNLSDEFVGLQHAEGNLLRVSS